MLLLVLLVGCTASHETASESGRNAPIRARLLARADGDIVRLALDVEQRLPRTVPVEVTLELPEGVELVNDAPRTLRSRHDARHFVLHGRPTDDATLYVRLDAEADGFGYHARLPYRFGRPAPVSAPPAREKAPLCVGTRCFGASVPAP